MYLRRLFKYWTLQVIAPGKLLRLKYEAFKELLRHDKKSLELITDLEETLHDELPVDWARVESLVRALRWSVGSLIRSLTAMHPATYADLEEHFQRLEWSLAGAVTLPEGDCRPPYAMTLAEAASAPELAGGKAHTLGRMLREANLPGPRGFVVTTRAFHLFLQHNLLRHRLDELLAQVCLDRGQRLEELAREMQAIILEGEVPPQVQEDIAQKLTDCREQGVPGPWVVRSSALSEDGDVSFAGQYDSVVGVPAAGVLEAYKHVLASKYSPRAVAYRLRCGLADQETPMAVLLLEMIDAAVSGVVYTHDTKAQVEQRPYLAIFAVPGPGQRLVDGSTIPEIHYLTREPELQPVETISSPHCPWEPGGKARVCLPAETAGILAGWGLTLEQLAGAPQDIEWCQDKNGALFLLQSRPLRMSSELTPDRLSPAQPPEITNPILLEGGVAASPGVGFGRVWVIKKEDELINVPERSVLVTPTLPPALAKIIDRLRAVVADEGSRASHFATVAREYGLPVLVGTLEATRCLTPGQPVTVDVSHGRVYQGEVEGLQEHAAQARARPETPFRARLRALMTFISPLTLTDPTSPEFTAEHCQSFHDVVRFAHEKGMAEMFSLVGRSGRGLARARKLVSDLPLVMYVLDLEGCLSPAAEGSKTVNPQLITCDIMRACWEGLSHPDVVWHKGLVHLDWEEFDRLSASMVSLSSKALASYAIMSRYYLHLILRFGYHFAVLDTFCGEDPEANYIAFRFKGGGASYENRLWRVQLIKMILEWAGFTVKTRGDLLDARFDRREARQILSRLTLLGILQGKTRLLDMALADEEQVLKMADDFQERYAGYIQG
ncbi:MAG: PEP/pyruvate-binding domain-containing protein [Syntrophobacterales bacterium]|jgi:pyruvate,water dikinase